MKEGENMKYKRIEKFPHGLTIAEATKLYENEDVYDIFETFETLNDSLEFIKENYGNKAYKYAKKDAEQNIAEEESFIKYMQDKHDLKYVGYTTFNICSDIENCKKDVSDRFSFVWFSSGKVIKVEFY